MARKTMKRQFTRTIVKVAKIEMVDGGPVAVPLKDMNLLGDVKIERAQRMADKEYKSAVTVLEVHPSTKTYEMSTELFMEHATVVEEEEN